MDYLYFWDQVKIYGNYNTNTTQKFPNKQEHMFEFSLKSKNTSVKIYQKLINYRNSIKSFNKYQHLESQCTYQNSNKLITLPKTMNIPSQNVTQKISMQQLQRALTKKQQVKQRKTAQAMCKYLQQQQMSENQIEQDDEFLKQQEKQIIVIEDQLIYNEIQNLYQQDKLSLEDGILLFLDNNQIFIDATKSKTLKIIKIIENLQKELKAKKIQTIVKVNEKEMNFIQKQFQSKINDTYKQNKIFSINYESLKTKPQQTFIIDINGKKLIIMYGNIANISCNAIVNSCNNKICFEDHLQLSGVAQSIMEMAGKQYSAFCNDYIMKNQELKYGCVLTYKMPEGEDARLDYIMNVSTPIYSSAQKTNQDLEIIKNTIDVIFKEARDLQFSSIAFPIFGSGACGYNYSDVATLIINKTLSIMLSNNCNLQEVYITEFNFHRVEELINIIKNIINPPQSIRQVKYQWQWQDNQYYNYDDEDVNRRIDEAYEQYQIKQRTTTIKLYYPFSKQPGTHIVDLIKGTITDLALSTSQKIEQKTVNSIQYFFIDSQQVDAQLNEYLVLQQMNQITCFNIFYKKYRIEFSKEGMYQINEDTNYKRSIRFEEIKKDVKNEKNVLQGLTFQFKSIPYKTDYIKSSQGKIKIQSFNPQLNKEIEEIINQELREAIISYPLTVPNISNADLENLKDFLQLQSLRITGKIQCGAQISLDLFKKKTTKFLKRYETLNKTIKKYPSEWQYLNTNKICIKVELDQKSSEFEFVSKLFKRTEKGQIHTIFRIQNKAIWDNYVNEKDKLKEIYRIQGQSMSSLEEEQYLWHGVRDQHPKVIYSGMKEAFDQTYSKVGLWGPGIYFAENASYSRDYSYKLTPSDDKNNAGKLVFLCCLVTTGKVEVKQQDQNIRRPSTGYDCVSGFTNGSNVFILYSMDIRRAYPAYEIIYT